jgi:outer membrane protein assembly factor BamB
MKRRITIFIVLSLLLSLTGLRSAFAQDWPQWRGENSDSRALGFNVPETWPEGLNQLWKKDVGFGDSTPALVDGKIFIFTRQGGNEVLRCLDVSTGNELWKNSYAADEVTGPAARHPGPRGTPAISDGKVVVLGATGIVSCYDTESGSLLWQYNEYANMVPSYFTGVSPLLLDGTCYVNLGGRDGSAMIAFDLRSGEILWMHKGIVPSYASPAVMNLGGVNSLVVQSDTILMGLSTKTGEELWEIFTPVQRRYYNSASPVIDGDKIFYTGQGNGTAAVKITRKGESYSISKLWRNMELGTNYNTPVLKEGSLFGLNERGSLFCLDASTGNTLWADTARHRDFGSIIDAGSAMVALSGTSNMIVYRPDTDKYVPIAIIKVADTPVYTHPVLSGKMIFIKDEESLILYSVE